MVHDEEFKTHALLECLDVSHNVGSNHYNSKVTRIAYYKFKGEIE